MNLDDRLNKIHWQTVAKNLSQNGFALVKDILSTEQCCELRQSWYNGSLFRKTVDMQRYKLGQGDYKYWASSPPGLVTKLRSYLYEKLTPVANVWQQQLSENYQYPAEHSEFLNHCQQKQQIFPSCVILRYEKDGFNRLHQDLYGELAFPLQVAILLSKPDKDFAGGEMIFTEQSARVQTQVTVVTPAMGDMVIFTTNYRPGKGKNGFRKMNVRHGVSKVRYGERFCLGIPFHDSKS